MAPKRTRKTRASDAGGMESVSMPPSTTSERRHTFHVSDTGSTLEDSLRKEAKKMTKAELVSKLAEMDVDFPAGKIKAFYVELYLKAALSELEPESLSPSPEPPSPSPETSDEKRFMTSKKRKRSPPLSEDNDELLESKRKKFKNEATQMRKAELIRTLTDMEVDLPQSNTKKPVFEDLYVETMLSCSSNESATPASSMSPTFLPTGDHSNHNRDLERAPRWSSGSTRKSMGQNSDGTPSATMSEFPWSDRMSIASTSARSDAFTDPRVPGSSRSGRSDITPGLRRRLNTPLSQDTNRRHTFKSESDILSSKYTKSSTKPYVVAILAILAVLVTLVLYFPQRPVVYCDTNEKPVEDDQGIICYPCPKNAECSGGFLRCKTGYKEYYRRCEEDEDIARDAQLMRSCMRDTLSERAGEKLCGKTVSDTMTKEELKNYVRTSEKVSYSDDARFDHTFDKAFEMLELIVPGDDIVMTPEGTVRSNSPFLSWSCSASLFWEEHRYLAFWCAGGLFVAMLLFLKWRRRNIAQQARTEVEATIKELMRDKKRVVVAQIKDDVRTTTSSRIGCNLADAVFARAWKQAAVSLKQRKRIVEKTMLIKGEQMIVWDWITSEEEAPITQRRLEFQQ